MRKRPPGIGHGHIANALRVKTRRGPRPCRAVRCCERASLRVCRVARPRRKATSISWWEWEPGRSLLDHTGVVLDLQDLRALPSLCRKITARYVKAIPDAKKLARTATGPAYAARTPALQQGRELASLSTGDSRSRLVSPLSPSRGNAEARTRPHPAPAALFASSRTRRKSARRSASPLAPPWERPRLRSRWVTARKAQRNTSTTHQPTASKSRK